MSNTVGESDCESESLSALFLQCERFVEKFDDLDMRQSSSKEAHSSMLSTIGGLQQAVHSLAMFSTNESLSELSTGDLRFLLVPVYTAFLYFNHPNMDTRLQNLQLAKKYYCEYIDLCESYDLFAADGEKDKKTEVDGLSSSQFASIENIKDAALRRELKIQRHRESAQLQAQISQLQRLAQEDEEMSRRLYLKRLRLWLYKALQHKTEIADELQMLEMRAKMAENSTDNQAEEKAASSQPKSAPLQTMILTRNNMQKQVFGAGYPSLPTMTVDEWAIQRQHKMDMEQTAQAANPMTVDDLTEEEKEEFERQRQMRMDVFTDEHRRGSGNMHNKG